MRLAASRTFCTAGNNRLISTPIMAITTSNSISVNALRQALVPFDIAGSLPGGLNPTIHCATAALALNPDPTLNRLPSLNPPLNLSPHSIDCDESSFPLQHKSMNVPIDILA